MNKKHHLLGLFFLFHTGKAGNDLIRDIHARHPVFHELCHTG